VFLVSFLFAEANRIRHMFLEVLDGKNASDYKNGGEADEDYGDGDVHIGEANEADPTEPENIETQKSFIPH